MLRAICTGVGWVWLVRQQSNHTSISMHTSKWTTSPLLAYSHKARLPLAIQMSELVKCVVFSSTFAMVAGGTCCSTAWGAGSRERRAKLFPAGEGQGELVLGDHKATARGGQVHCQEQGEGARRLRREASSWDQGQRWCSPHSQWESMLVSFPCLQYLIACSGGKPGLRLSTCLACRS